MLPEKEIASPSHGVNGGRWLLLIGEGKPEDLLGFWLRLRRKFSEIMEDAWFGCLDFIGLDRGGT